MTQASTNEPHARTVHLFSRAVDSMKKSWHNPANAGPYHRYATRHPLYLETSRRLVELAELEPGMKVVDLACGTGLTTAAILAAGVDGLDILAVDQSEAQLALARQYLPSGQVRFLHSPAERIDRRLDERVDRVICNAAFWQLKTDEIFKALATILAEEGKLLFNTGAWMFPSLERSLIAPELLAHAVDDGADTSSLVNLIRRIAKIDYGYTRPTSPNRGGPRYEASFTASMRQAGFAILKTEGYMVKQSPEAVYGWYQIPIFREMLLPGLETDLAQAVLEKAYAGWRPTKNCLYSCMINFVVGRSSSSI